MRRAGERGPPSHLAGFRTGGDGCVRVTQRDVRGRCRRGSADARAAGFRWNLGNWLREPAERLRVRIVSHRAPGSLVFGGRRRRAVEDVRVRAAPDRPPPGREVRSTQVTREARPLVGLTRHVSEDLATVDALDGRAPGERTEFRSAAVVARPSGNKWHVHTELQMGGAGLTPLATCVVTVGRPYDIRVESAGTTRHRRASTTVARSDGDRGDDGDGAREYRRQQPRHRDAEGDPEDLVHRAPPGTDHGRQHGWPVRRRGRSVRRSVGPTEVRVRFMRGSRHDRCSI